MTSEKERKDKIIDVLKKAYPNADCELEYGTVFQLLVAVILSAQCTDKRVNMVTDRLYKIAATPRDFDEMPQEELEKHIFSCGFYHNKAKNIKAAAHDILTRFNGEVPDTLEELVSLAGVGRKTANVILATAFKKNAIAVDTHVFRVSRRLGLSSGKTPHKVETDLSNTYSGESLAAAHNVLIFLGRYCCHSQKPSCANCAVLQYCPYESKNIK